MSKSLVIALFVLLGLAAVLTVMFRGGKREATFESVPDRSSIAIVSDEAKEAQLPGDAAKSPLRPTILVEAFERGKADFSGINGVGPGADHSLFIEKVIHEAFIDVDENGTKAAAATAVQMGAAGAATRREPEPIEFIADHPFLFIIRDNKTGCVLFLGRVVDPSKG